VYNPTIAWTSPSTEKTGASTATAMPRSRAVRVVMGPMEATATPSRAAAPAAATKFRTVEELVKVTQSGWGAPPNIAAAWRAACCGGTVR
jgi:hypothetical protein